MNLPKISLSVGHSPAKLVFCKLLSWKKENDLRQSRKFNGNEYKADVFSFD